MPQRYPEVELLDGEFDQLLALVDALNPQQLLRLYCRVGAAIGPLEVIENRRDEDTLPPPPPTGVGPSSFPKISIRPGVVAGVFEEELDWGDLVEPGV